jgi:tol-pal system protein YbgF
MLSRLAVLLLLGGCFADDTARVEVGRLKRQLEDLRRQTDGDRHTVHELENRVFILEDKVDTAQVAHDKMEKVPRLPVVTKAPPAPAPAAAPAGGEPPVDGEEAYEEPEPGPPVVIRMKGKASLPQRLPAERRSSEPPDLAAVDEKLPVATVRPLPPARAADDAMTAYKDAYAALSRHEHKTAIAAFRAFVARHPEHDYADNAQYWLGEAFYDQADYQTALVEFRAVLKRFPGGNKAPDALLKIGFCLDKLGDAGAAGDALAQVAEIYPRTDAARLASKRLDEIRRVTR